MSYNNVSQPERRGTLQNAEPLQTGHTGPQTDRDMYGSTDDGRHLRTRRSLFCTS